MIFEHNRTIWQDFIEFLWFFSTSHFFGNLLHILKQTLQDLWEECASKNNCFTTQSLSITPSSCEQLISLNSNKHWQNFQVLECSVVQADPSFSLPALARLINFVINSFSLNDWRREPAPKASIFKGHTICRFGQTLSRNHFSGFFVWSRSNGHAI